MSGRASPYCFPTAALLPAPAVPVRTRTHSPIRNDAPDGSIAMAPSISNPSSVGDLPTPQSRTRTFRKLSVAQLFKALDWFVPEELRSESEDHQRARMFLISHIAGPILSIP